MNRDDDSTIEDVIDTMIDQIDRMASAGMVVAVDPDVAEAMGAFEDDALSPEDALEARFDDVAEGDD